MKYIKRLSWANIYLGLTVIGLIVTWWILSLIYILRWQKPCSLEHYTEIAPDDHADMCFGVGILVVLGIPTLIINLCTR